MQKYSKQNVQCYISIPLEEVTCLSRYTVAKGFWNKEYYYENVEMMRPYVYKFLVFVCNRIIICEGTTTDFLRWLHDWDNY